MDTGPKVYDLDVELLTKLLYSKPWPPWFIVSIYTDTKY